MELKQKRKSRQLIIRGKSSGFTLIELLIASSILVVVFTTGLSLFSGLMNSYWQMQANLQTTQEGRAVMEAISREARLAEDFTIESSSQLSLTTQDGEKKTYYLDGGVIYLKKEGGKAQPLTSPLVSVSNFDLKGSDFSLSSQQPWLQIEFTLQYQGEKGERFGSRQTFRTAITSRRYRDE